MIAISICCLALAIIAGAGEIAKAIRQLKENKDNEDD